MFFFKAVTVNIVLLSDIYLVLTYFPVETFFSLNLLFVLNFLILEAKNLLQDSIIEAQELVNDPVDKNAVMKLSREDKVGFFIYFYCF